MDRLERGDRLVTLLGQFNAQNQTERLYDQLSFDVYYHASSSDWTAPSITRVASNLAAGNAAVTVETGDASGFDKLSVTTVRLCLPARSGSRIRLERAMKDLCTAQ